MAELIVLVAKPARPTAPVLVAPRHPTACTVRPGRNLAGEPRDTLVLPDTGVSLTVLPSGTSDVGPDRLAERAALGRALLTVGALRRVLELTIRYAGERVQFGRPISRFQAVQQHLARIAGAVEQAEAMADTAVAAVSTGAQTAGQAVLAAKICGAQAATLAAAASHQVHGAIGFTTEHDLHRYTTRLLAWRDEDGSELDCSVALGRSVTAGGGAHLWDLLTASARSATR